MSAACDLLTKSTQAKHIVSSKLICESFRRAMEMDPPAEGQKEKETVAYALANHAKAALFLASDNSESKIFNVMSDLLAQGVIFK